MIAKKQSPPNIVEESVYELDNIPYFKIFFFLTITFFIGLTLNFSLRDKIKTDIGKALASSSICPISYSQMDLKFLFPAFKLNKMQIPSSCFQTLGPPLEFDFAELKLISPSFLPFGLKFGAQVLSQDINLQLTLAMGLPAPKFRLHESTIDARIINQIIAKPNLLKGKFQIEAAGELSGSDLEQANILLKATSLLVPPQSIQGYNTPALNFGDAAATIRLIDKTKLNIDDFAFGNENSPIIGEMSGEIRINEENMNSSELNLLTRIKFSPSFFEALPFNKELFEQLALNGKKANEDGFYELNITGSLNSPKIL